MSLPEGPIVVEIVKIAGYLLNDRHPTGKTKAAFFAAFGFDPDDPLALATALARHGRDRPVVGKRSNAFGIAHEVRCDLHTPDGRNPCIVSIWFRATGDLTLRLITAYPVP